MKRLLFASIALLALVAEPAFAAKLQILEFSGYAVIGGGQRADFPPMPPLVEQTPVDFTAGATSSAAFNSATTFVNVRCDVQCSVKFGGSPQTATTANMILSAGVHYRFGVTPGQLVSVIASP